MMTGTENVRYWLDAYPVELRGGWIVEDDVWETALVLVAADDSFLSGYDSAHEAAEALTCCAEGYCAAADREMS